MINELFRRIAPHTLETCLATLLILSALPIIAGYALYGELFYDDWKCGFAQCRMIVESKE